MKFLQGCNVSLAIDRSILVLILITIWNDPGLLTEFIPLQDRGSC